jgi:hypothetical protein
MLIPCARRLWVVTLLAAPLAACSNPPIDPVNLADQAALHVREVVHQSGGGVGFSTRDTSGLHSIGSGLGNTADAVSGVMAAMPPAMPPGMMSAMGSSSAGMSMAGMPSMQTTEEQFDSTADDLKTWLRERVLANTNLESKTDDEAIYLLNPDPTCRALPVDGDPPGTLPPLNQHCADQLTKLAVRVSMRADGDGVRLTVMVGPARLQASAFIIHSDLIAVETDLPQAYAASQYADMVLGTDSPTSSTHFETLAGKWRISLHKDGDKKVTGAFSVLSDIHVATTDSTGAPGPDIQLGASDPTLAVTGDGNAESLTVKVAMGALDEKGNWDPKGTGVPNRDLHVAVGGLTGQATFTEASAAIDITGLGVGDTAIDVRDMRIFDLTLNPADMHRFDLHLTDDQTTQEALAQLTPRFDLSLGFQLGLIASDYTTPPASYLTDENYGIKLDNGGAPAGITGAPASGTFPGGLKVTAGTLSISSNKVTDPVVVPAGKCLISLGTAPAGSHPLLGKLSVVDCP